MKKVISIFISAMALSGISCTDNSDALATTHEVSYLVEAGSNNWYGEYISSTGEKICNCKIPLLSSGWQYKFTVEAPFTLHIDATVDSPLYGTSDAPDITTKIFVDGLLVASNTSRWTKGATSSDYEIQ